MCCSTSLSVCLRAFMVSTISDNSSLVRCSRLLKELYALEHNTLVAEMLQIDSSSLESHR